MSDLSMSPAPVGSAPSWSIDGDGVLTAFESESHATAALAVGASRWDGEEFVVDHANVSVWQVTPHSPLEVHVAVHVDGGESAVQFSPAEARRFARQLLLMADAADGVDADATVSIGEAEVTMAREGNAIYRDMPRRQAFLDAAREGDRISVPRMRAWLRSAYAQRVAQSGEATR